MSSKRPSDFLTNIGRIRAEATFLAADATRVSTLLIHAPGRNDVVEELLGEVEGAVERLNALAAKLRQPVTRFPRVEDVVDRGAAKPWPAQ